MQIRLNNTNHRFEKQNLVTLRDGSDILKCKHCGMTGKVFKLDRIDVPDGSQEYCPEAAIAFPTKIRIIACQAQGPQFKNLTPGSEHEVVPPAPGYQNDSKGVWVMGVGEPVKVLTDEFRVLERRTVLPLSQRIKIIRGLA